MVILQIHNELIGVLETINYFDKIFYQYDIFQKIGVDVRNIQQEITYPAEFAFRKTPV